MNRLLTAFACTGVAFVLLAFRTAPISAPSTTPQSVFTDTISRTSSEIISGNFAMTENGMLKGFFSSTYNGQAKIEERNLYVKSANKDTYIAGMLPFEAAQVDSFGLSDIEALNQPLKRIVYCQMPLTLRKMGDMQSFELPIQTDYLYNPFDIEPDKKGNFNMPLDVKNQYTLSITFPEDYVIEAKPENQSVGMAGRNCKVYFMSSIVDNVLQINYKLQMSAGEYSEQEFEQFKTLAGKVALKKTETVIIRKKSNWASKIDKKN
jgi:hypothetical protein